jgi:hypothetical protein
MTDRVSPPNSLDTIVRSRHSGRFRIMAHCGMAERAINKLALRDRQRVVLRKSNRTSSIKVWSNPITLKLPISVRLMRKIKKTSDISATKPEIRTWYAFEGPLGNVIHNKRFFFAWKEGCLMGTYNTLEEATTSLTP